MRLTLVHCIKVVHNTFVDMETALLAILQRIHAKLCSNALTLHTEINAMPDETYTPDEPDPVYRSLNAGYNLMTRPTAEKQGKMIELGKIERAIDVVGEIIKVLGILEQERGGGSGSGDNIVVNGNSADSSAQLRI